MNRLGIHSAPTGRRRIRVRIACACGLIAAVALFARAAAAAGIHAGIVPLVSTPALGDTVVVELRITTADAAFNAFDASIQFDPARLAFVATAPVSNQIGPVMTGACSQFFHQFAPHSDSVEIHLSMLCANTSVTGPGSIYRVRFRTIGTTGSTALTCGPSTMFYNGGLFVRPLDLTPATLQVGNGTGVDSPAAPGPAFTLESPHPNPAFSGALTLAYAAPAPRHVRFDLLDTQGRRVATRDAGRVAAGRGTLTWEGLRLEPGLYFVRMSAGAGSPLPRAWVVLR